MTDVERAIKAYAKAAAVEVENAVDGFDTSSENIVRNPQISDTVQYVLDHKNAVRKRLTYLANQLLERAEHHDDSKLKFPEILWLSEMDKEPRYPYGTPEYADKKKRWKELFEHHYKYNRHHPEHFVNGVEGMSLTDLCEYLIDISSYQNVMHPEQVMELLNGQAERFKLSEQLNQILKNTLLEYFAYFGDDKPKAYEALL